MIAYLIAHVPASAVTGRIFVASRGKPALRSVDSCQPRSRVETLNLA